MSTPEDALARAREEAAAARAAGEYGGELDSQDESRPAVTTAKLMEWAVISPDLRDVRSTRRYGGPVTAVKRALVRLLAQYHGDLNAQQTRFNVNLMARVVQLEQRIEELERERREP